MQAEGLEHEHEKGNKGGDKDHNPPPVLVQRVRFPGIIEDIHLSPVPGKRSGLKIAKMDELAEVNVLIQSRMHYPLSIAELDVKSDRI